MFKRYGTLFCTLIVCASLGLLPYSLSARSLSLLVKDARLLAACATKAFEAKQTVPFSTKQAKFLPDDKVNVLKASDITKDPLATQEPAWKKGLKYAAIGTAVVLTCVAVCVAAYYGLAFSYEAIALKDLSQLSSALKQRIALKDLSQLSSALKQSTSQRITNIERALEAPTNLPPLPALEETLGNTLTRTHLGPLTHFTDNEAFDLGFHLTDNFIDDGFTSAGALLGETPTLWDQADTVLCHAAEHAGNAEALLDKLDQLLSANTMNDAFRTALSTIQPTSIEPAIAG